MRHDFNVIYHRPSLYVVVGPLVRLYDKADLSWADRAELSAAIGSCYRHWMDMEAERQELEQRNCQQQMSGQAPDYQGGDAKCRADGDLFDPPASVDHAPGDGEGVLRGPSTKGMESDPSGMASLSEA